MQKKLRKVAIMFICFGLLLQSAGCGNNSDKDNQIANTEISGVTVWSAPSTVKVLREDVEYEDKHAAELNYNAVRNEYESQQLILTSSKDVGSYYLATSDLKNGEYNLSKDNITVYNEKYVHCTREYYESGYYPDALVPIDAAKNHGELTIAKNSNAGLWITVYVPKETPAGVYEGSFELSIDDKTTEIPVKLTVNDYTLTDETTAKTLFSWRYDRVGTGELDSSIEMIESYYEFFLDYRISLQCLPMESLTGEEIVASLEKYYDRLSTYCLQSELGVITTNMSTYREVLREQILAIAAASSPEKNYLDKAMLYVIDEPSLENPAAFERYETVMTWLQEIADEIKNDKTGTYDEFKKIEGWEKYVADMPNVVPQCHWALEYQDNETITQYLNSFNVFCPHTDLVSGGRNAEVLDVTNKFDLDLWWYTSILPFAPGPNYHIGNSNLLSSRTLSWLQKKYNVIGNLYWDAVAYTTSGTEEYVNVYEDPYRREGLPAGDGNLAYPGAPYDVYGAIPSMRLMSIRDGMEEYEILKDVENAYVEFAKGFGNNVKIDDIMEQFYQDVYDGKESMYADGEAGLNFDELRAALLETAVMCSRGVGFVVQSEDRVSNQIKLTYLVSEGVDVYIDGVKQEAVNGFQYEYLSDMQEDRKLKFEFKLTDGTTCATIHTLSEPVLELQTVSDDSILKDIKVGPGSTVELVETSDYSTDGTSAYFNVNGVITGNEMDDLTYVPTAEIYTRMFENISNLSEVQVLKADIYNPGDKFEFSVSLYSGDTFVNIGTYQINNGKNELSLNIAQSGFNKLDTVDRICFNFVNSDDGKTAKNYQFYIDSIVATK